MCGIAGYWSRGDHAIAPTVLRRMTTCIAHRGPDDEGAFHDDASGIALGHRRLAVVDLSPEGHQPMTSETGRFIIVFNGEIYNYRQLAAELIAAGARFRGHSDTEVMLAAFDHWGLDAAVRRFVGIFAFALWDRRDHALHLVRDHLGVKPLYYGVTGQGLAFGSELRALEQFPGIERTINRDAIALLLRYNCIPAPHSIYRGVLKLPPGHILTMTSRSAAELVPRPFWSASAVASTGLRQPSTLSDDDAVQALDDLLRNAIGLQMVADVPLGAFLSGGIDSSTVVALMQAQSMRPVRTFSIGFAEEGFDESQHARVVAQHLGTEHTELQITPQHALAIVPRLSSLYDEPFADSSQIPTVLVSEMARRHVTVALSGDGGDELFAGYNRHIFGEALWRRIRYVPSPIRRMAAELLLAIPPRAIARLAAVRPRRPGRQLNEAHAAHYIHKMARVLGARGASDMYLGLVSHWTRPEQIVIGSHEPRTLVTDETGWPHGGSFTDRMMYLDLVTYLPDDILTKVDRASMAVALEARVPLLDHRVVEFAAHVPLAQKLRDGRGKWLLRQVLGRYVPDSMVDRPKAGFGVPLARWLRGPLRDWAEALLDERRLAQEGFFHVAPIRRAWSNHLRCREDLQFPLWDVLMFQAWLDERTVAA
ncbi:MAG: asparagine synthase (glutamine-hydrolyzing) [bacterium]